MVLGLCACSADATPSEPMDNYTNLITETEIFPDAYRQPSAEPGQIVTENYDTKDYADGTDKPRVNHACVYLPNSYDEGLKHYNVLYLIHGHYGIFSTYLSFENGLFKNVLDNMIERGDIPPMIVVTPSYNYGSPTSNYVYADKYCEAMTQELLYDLMPFIESKYSTYADSTDPDGLEKSRDHRAIGGFSMGGVTTWYAFEHLLPYIRDYVPISGDCWSLGTFAGMNRPDETAEYLADIVRQSGFDNNFYIWAASGTGDSAYHETLAQIEAMARIPSVFHINNMSFHEKANARHEYGPTVEYLYNALRFLFHCETGSSSVTSISASQESRASDDYSIDGRKLRGNERGIHISKGKKYIKIN